ncbi:MAG: LytTR family DNA-binding domain-containing protein [Cytophagales bacterium]|nr:LytTR family DNA-binding domain-containing protein [Cytophagales bacterium]
MDSTCITCIAVDDEPRALGVIENFARKIDFMDLVGTFRDPLDAVGFLHQNKVRLIFLDINMPELSGVEFVKSLSNPPLIIFTTAYSEYALESYEYETLDYLLKPIAFPRFLTAVQKAVKRLSVNQKTESENNDQLILKSAGSIHRIIPSEILYLEVQGNYLKIITVKESITIKSGLQEFLDKYKRSDLIRTHRSFAVNKQRVDKIKYNRIYIENQELTIGRNYREVVKKYFNS